MLKVNIKAPYTLKKHLSTDAGWDLQSVEQVVFQPGDCKVVNTGCQIDMRFNGPRPTANFMTSHPLNDYALMTGLEAQVRGRSSMAKKGFITHFGTVDETYHSEIGVVMLYMGKEPYTIEKGHKVAQLVFATLLPIETVEVDDMQEDRDGYGSSGQ